MAGDALSAVEYVFRQERGRVLAGLMRRFGDLGLAEDVLQEACRKALELWPRTGIPDHPAAWLSAVARNAGLDLVRRAGKSVVSHFVQAGFDIVGRDGLKLSDAWAQGMRSLHGVHVHGFPNAFFVQPARMAAI